VASGSRDCAARSGDVDGRWSGAGITWSCGSVAGGSHSSAGRRCGGVRDRESHATCLPSHPPQGQKCHFLLVLFWLLNPWNANILGRREYLLPCRFDQMECKVEPPRGTLSSSFAPFPLATGQSEATERRTRVPGVDSFESPPPVASLAPGGAGIRRIEARSRLYSLGSSS